MTEKRFKLANPNNKFKNMNIGIVENGTCMLKLTDIVDLLNTLDARKSEYREMVDKLIDENEQLKKQIKDMQIRFKRKYDCEFDNIVDELD